MIDFDYSKPHKFVDGMPYLLTEEEIIEQKAICASYKANVLKSEKIKSAKNELQQSDITVLRYLESQMPEEWISYRNSLRDVVSERSETMPNKPDYPGST